MRKRCTLAYIVAIMMVFTLLAPIFNAPTAQAYGIPNIVDEMNKIIPYLDPAEKEAIGAARDALGEISSGDWDTVLGIGTDNNLLTDAVIAKFDGETDDAKKAAAKAALIQVGIDLGQIYYLQDGQALENDLRDFKENNIGTFEKLFGSETTVDDLYQLMEATRGQFAAVVKANTGYFDDLAFGSNNDLVNCIPDVINAAMQNALNDQSKPKLTRFRGKLETIGWSTTKLINQQKELGNIIDPSKAARLALAKAAVRSETKLGDSSPTTFAVGDPIPSTIFIMEKDATQWVEWQSSDPSVVEVTTDEQTSNYVLTAKGTGTATLTAFRDVDVANPAADSDWIFKYDVTVNATMTTYTLTLSGEGLTSNPAAGAIAENTSVTITVTPAEGKQVATFTVNGTDKKADLIDGKYTFNITADTIVAVTYEDILSVVFGDVDGVAGITANDASLVLQHFLGKITLQGNNLLAADVDGTAGITANDASLVLQKFLGKINNFPVEP